MRPLSLDGVRSATVIAPHPDDESLGAGGLLARLARQDANLSVVFVTDGGASHRAPGWPRHRLAAVRREEGGEAVRRLGAGAADLLFLALPDADMPLPGTPPHAAALAALRDHLSRHRPDLLVLPWRRDPHRDHRDAHALANLAAAAAGIAPVILEYAIWLDEWGAPEDRPRPAEVEIVELDISTVREAKREAIAAHRSQTTDLVPDPDGFRLTESTIARLCGPVERFFRAC